MLESIYILTNEIDYWRIAKEISIGISTMNNVLIFCFEATSNEWMKSFVSLAKSLRNVCDSSVLVFMAKNYK